MAMKGCVHETPEGVTVIHIVVIIAGKRHWIGWFGLVWFGLVRVCLFLVLNCERCGDCYIFCINRFVLVIGVCVVFLVQGLLKFLESLRGLMSILTRKSSAK